MISTGFWRNLLQVVVSGHALVMLYSRRIEHYSVYAVQAMERRTMVTSQPPIFEHWFVDQVVFCIMDLRKVPRLCLQTVHPNPKLGAEPIDSKNITLFIFYMNKYFVLIQTFLNATWRSCSELKRNVSKMGKNAESHKVVKNVSENSNSSGNCCKSCHVQSRNSNNNGLCSLVSLFITCPKRSLNGWPSETQSFWMSDSNPDVVRKYGSSKIWVRLEITQHISRPSFSCRTTVRPSLIVVAAIFAYFRLNET